MTRNLNSTSYSCNSVVLNLIHTVAVAVNGLFCLFLFTSRNFIFPPVTIRQNGNENKSMKEEEKNCLCELKHLH